MKTDSRRQAAQERLRCGAKRCRKCGEVKPLGLFRSAAWSLDGKVSWCKECLGRPPNFHDRRFKFRVSFAKGTVEIPLTQGRWAIIDIQDSERVLRYKWHVYMSNNRHAAYAWAHPRKGDASKVKTIKMHRLILAPPAGLEVDHIDGDGLNNRRSNLRLATRKQNRHNSVAHKNSSSKFKGVFWNKRHGKWHALIYCNGHARHLGLFRSEEQAGAAYDVAAIKYQGDFAKLNEVSLCTDHPRRE